MTYIEFFDKTATENVAACLTYAPKRVIYIGDNANLMKKHIENYKEVFKDKGDIEFLYETVKKNSLDEAVALLSKIVETYDNCAFDLTGGDDTLLFALGIVYNKYSEKNLQIHRFNLRNNVIFDFDKDGETIYKDTPMLSVDDNVKIYGGEIAYGTVDEENTYKWDLNEEFLRDIELIWNVCKTNVRYWNMQIGILEAIENSGTQSVDGLTTTVSHGNLEHYLTKHRLKYKKASGIINYLLKNGLLTAFNDNADTPITVSYKNKQVKRCLTVAGQALEMKIFVTVKNLEDKDGNLIYNDALNGVVIDWDGEFHDEEKEGIYDTENEIDVMLMRGVIPIFVSCKNGIITSEELYKLNTVAERFGGLYAKKVLIATSLDAMKESGEYLRQRAKDMNIRIIEKVFDDKDLIKNLRTLSGTKV